MTLSENLRFFEYSNGTVVCEDCFKEDCRKTARGEFSEDEAVYPNMASELTDPEVALQCDNCLAHTANYFDEDEDEDE